MRVLILIVYTRLSASLEPEFGSCMMITPLQHREYSCTLLDVSSVHGSVPEHGARAAGPRAGFHFLAQTGM